MSKIFSFFLTYKYKTYPNCRKADLISKYSTLLFRLAVTWLFLEICSIIYNVANSRPLLFMVLERRTGLFVGILGISIGMLLQIRAAAVNAKEKQNSKETDI